MLLITDRKRGRIHVFFFYTQQKINKSCFTGEIVHVAQVMCHVLLTETQSSIKRAYYHVNLV